MAKPNDEQANVCISCGRLIPEGRMVCPICEKGFLQSDEMLDKLWEDIKEHNHAEGKSGHID